LHTPRLLITPGRPGRSLLQCVFAHSAAPFAFH
jgi:hypothetical protein